MSRPAGKGFLRALANSRAGEQSNKAKGETIMAKLQPFTWRGIRFTQDPHDAGGYRSEAVELTNARSTDWKVGILKGSATWFARLRVGSDRFPGRGGTAAEALDSAAAEARLVLRLMKVALSHVDGPKKAAAKRKAGK